MKHVGGDRPGIRDTALRRFREAVCLTCAALLWLAVWGLERQDFDGRRGHTALFALGLVEAVTLAVLFWREQTTEREIPTPWITVAWATLPVWVALEFLVGSVLGRL